MEKRNYLIGLLIGLILLAFLVPFCIDFYLAKRGERGLEYRDMVAFFTGIIVSGALIINTLNTKISAAFNESKLNFDKMKFQNDKKLISYNLINEYSSTSQLHLKKAVEFTKMHSNLNEVQFVTKLEEDIESRESITYLLNQLEIISISYKEDIADKVMIKEFFLDIFKILFNRFELYIKARQKEAKSSNVFDTFEEVTREWLKGK